MKSVWHTLYKVYKKNYKKMCINPMTLIRLALWFNIITLNDFYMNISYYLYHCILLSCKTQQLFIQYKNFKLFVYKYQVFSINTIHHCMSYKSCKTFYSIHIWHKNPLQDVCVLFSMKGAIISLILYRTCIGLTWNTEGNSGQFE